MIVLYDCALGQRGLKHVQVDILQHCDTDQLCAFVGLQCGNQNNRWPWIAMLWPQKSYIHKKLKKSSLHLSFTITDNTFLYTVGAATMNDVTKH
jgi:hypothetical protein